MTKALSLTSRILKIDLPESYEAEDTRNADPISCISMLSPNF